MASFKVGDRVEYRERGTGEVENVGVIVRCDSPHDGERMTVAWTGGGYAPEYPFVRNLVLAGAGKDNPRVGDTVRVVLEGEVQEVAEYGFSVTGLYWLAGDMDEVKSIEIIEPAKPSVADLPVGSVVKADGSVFQKCGNNDWSTMGEEYTTQDLDLDILGWTLLVEQSNG